MRRRAEAVLGLALACAMPPAGVLAPATAAPASGTPGYVRATGIRLETVATGLDHPVYLASPRHDRRLFVVEQVGRIRIIRAGRMLRTPFLDLRDRVRAGGEQGLLSVAFHPRYATNGLLFVNYTDRRGDTRVERYRVTADPDRADPRSARLLLHIDQPYANHNGGLVMFGPDGMLYVGMGDGGSAGDPHGNGQDLKSLLGKMLRIDVDHGDPYAIPRDNPFVGRADARPEIWALGLRNPWRFCFDRTRDLLYIADVGQNLWEEIDVAPARAGALNYGWNRREGEHPFAGRRADPPGMTEPVEEFDHGQGCSITGGFVYRGRRIPALVGHYLFSDYCAGWIRSLRVQEGRVAERREWSVGRLGAVTSFGEDADGELYVMTEGGRVARIVAAP